MAKSEKAARAAPGAPAKATKARSAKAAKAPATKPEAPAKAPSAKSAKAAKAPTTRAAKESAAEKPKAKRASASAAGLLSYYEVICSECYEDFAFYPTVGGEQVECPGCGHVAGWPDDEAIARMTVLRRREVGKSRISALLAVVGFGCILAGIASASSTSGAGWEPPAGLIYGLCGGGALAVLLAAFLGISAERSRWDFYF
ncbi:MAG: hypothetical protein HY722_12195 [Planctomycetes bacterium]|nr:hypothetical protein [Planctomycetota bacterium]